MSELTERSGRNLFFLIIESNDFLSTQSTPDSEFKVLQRNLLN